MNRIRYRLTHAQEAGALAELLSATTSDGTTVVVKLFYPHTSDRAYARELLRVNERLTGLAARGVLDVREVGVVQGRLAVVRRAHEGKSLGQILPSLVRREVFISPPMAVTWMLDITESVGLAHTADVVHGALTPGNLLVGTSGQGAVCDFGALAALHAAPTLVQLFRHGGRSGYRAPEVARGAPARQTSDVYSLGVALYELLTLEEVPSETSEAHKAALRPPSRIERRIPGRLDPVVMRALEPNAARRYATCDEFAAALRSFLATSGGVAPLELLGRLASESRIPDMGRGLPILGEFELQDVSTLPQMPLESGQVLEPLEKSGRPSAAAVAATPADRADDEDTDPEPERVEAWTAPVGPMKVVRRLFARAANASVGGRLRVVRDVDFRTPMPSKVKSDAGVIPIRFPKEPQREHAAHSPLRMVWAPRVGWAPKWGAGTWLLLCAAAFLAGYAVRWASSRQPRDPGAGKVLRRAETPGRKAAR
ncbi:MAG: serine/threonine-protein kinase [Myxococcaceae bacterium]